MTVRELVEELSKYDQDMDLSFRCIIEQGRGTTWIQVGECYTEDEDGEIVLHISGDEEEDGGFDYIRGELIFPFFFLT
jgi:hypothetical protein